MRITDKDGNDITPTCETEPFKTAVETGQCYLPECTNSRRQGYWDCDSHAVPYPMSCHVYQFDPPTPERSSAFTEHTHTTGRVIPNP